MYSARHFCPLLGFQTGNRTGPWLGFFLKASASTRSSSSKTTRWCHRMLVVIRGGVSPSLPC